LSTKTGRYEHRKLPFLKKASEERREESARWIGESGRRGEGGWKEGEGGWK
jgi:hypothetical protein